MTTGTGGDTGVTTAAPAAAAPAVAAVWTDSIQDTGLKDWAVNKGYNKMSAADVAPTIAMQYHNLEKLFGADKAGKTVEIPDFEKGDATALGSFYDRVGRPKDFKDYDLALPADGVDAGFEKWARETFHGAGLSAKQANSLGKAWNDFGAAQSAAAQAASQQKFEAEDKALKTEWGAAYDNKMSLAASAAKALGIPGEVLDTLQGKAGYGAVIKTFANIAARIGEDQFIRGEGAGGGKMTPAEADAQLKSLQGNKDWMASWLDKAHPKHKEAVAQKARLTEMLSAGIA